MMSVQLSSVFSFPMSEVQVILCLGNIAQLESQLNPNMLLD